MKPTPAFFALVIVILLAVFLGMKGIEAPAVAPADSPSESFSAQRALEHLQAIAQGPRPLGSEAHAQARAYIAGTLEALGLEPQLQEATVVRPPGRRDILAARVVNIAVRLPGQEAGKAVLLVSHYDSVPNSPGAGDDGAGVAALLETLRALTQGPALRNDVIALFTDAEEIGLLGAHAFMEEHPWAAEVGMVLNFEARGSRGPALMFEPSSGNAPVVRALGRAVPDPRASSYSYEIYRRLPNDTDFSVFRRAGLPGLNFAFIDGATAYHTAQDDLEHLDLRSVQHMGDSALGLARHYGAADLEAKWQGLDANYFNFGPFFFSFLGVWVPPLTILVALAVIALVGFCWQRLSLGGLLLALLAHLLGVVVMAVLFSIATPFVFTRAYNFSLWQGHTSNALLLLALSLLAIGLTVLFYRLTTKKITRANFIGGGLLLWLVLTGLITVVLAPGACYLFTFPLLGSTVATALWWRRPPAEGDEVPSLSPAVVVLLALAAVVTTLLWVPTLVLIGQALGPGAAMLIGVFTFLLLASLHAPLMALIDGGTGRLVAWGAIAAGLVLIVAVRLSAGFDADNRRLDSLFYALDLESGEAQWLSYDKQPDAWTEHFLSSAPEHSEQPSYLGPSWPVLSQPASRAPIEAPQVEVLDAAAAAGRRALLIRWPTPVQRMTIALRNPDAVRGLVIEGEEIPRRKDVVDGGSPYGTPVRFYAPPAAGLRLEVELENDAPLELELVGQRYGLPALAELTAAPRPADTMPAYSWNSDSTFIRGLVTVPQPSAEPEPEAAADETATTPSATTPSEPPS